nr:hypothetical protein [Treponema sp.]
MFFFNKIRKNATKSEFHAKTSDKGGSDEEEETDFESWTWEAKDVTGVSADKASADGATLVADCLSITGSGNIYRTSSDGSVASVEIAKDKAGAAKIVIGGNADLVLTIGSTSSSNESASNGLYSDSTYSTLVPHSATTGTAETAGTVSVTGGTGAATITYSNIAAGTYYFVTGNTARAVRLSKVEVTKK